MNKERLLKLATLLHDHSRGKKMRIPGDGTPIFDLSTWIMDDAKCGTAACAVGCAMLSPWFQKRGLGTGKMLHPWRGKITVPTFGRKKEFAAVEAFFEIKSFEATYLFHPNHYDGDPTPKQVAKRIRKFVAEHA